MENLLKRWNTEVSDMWLAGWDDIRQWLGKDDVRRFRRAALRYLRINKFSCDEQRSNLLRIIEHTA